MIKKRMPFQAIQEAVCNLLKKYQSTPVYEYVPLKVKPPYITFGDIQISDDSAKGTNLYTVDMIIEAYSIKHTRSEINEMINDTATLLSSCYLGEEDMLSDKFQVIDRTILDAQTSPSEQEGYSGELHVQFLIQDRED